MGLGTWSWGNQFLWGYSEDMDGELREVFREACDRGINLFDTADSYGTGALDGRSEKLLGEFSEEYCADRKKPRSSLVLATKLAPYPWRVTTGSFLTAAKASAQRMRLDTLDVGQLHWSTANYQPLQERALWSGLAALAERGVAREVGLSNYGPKQMVKICDFLAKEGVALGSAQVQISLLSWGPLQRDVLDACTALGVLPIAYSPLALGMLTGRHRPGDASTYPKGPRNGLYKQVLGGSGELYGVLDAVAAERNKSVPQVALNWCMCKGTVPIPGARNVAQLRSNLGACGWRLSDGEVEELERAAARGGKGMVQNIFQTS
ncbi:unnamed protein product [Pedinophyceae sp. YPF-701]|nr:unnamed protein product [Pedinophyceae sp. YPF-701]